MQLSDTQKNWNNFVKNERRKKHGCITPLLILVLMILIIILVSINLILYRKTTTEFIPEIKTVTKKCANRRYI